LKPPRRPIEREITETQPGFEDRLRQHTRAFEDPDVPVSDPVPRHVQECTASRDNATRRDTARRYFLRYPPRSISSVNRADNG